MSYEWFYNISSCLVMQDCRPILAWLEYDLWCLSICRWATLIQLIDMKVHQHKFHTQSFCFINIPCHSHYLNYAPNNLVPLAIIRENFLRAVRLGGLWEVVMMFIQILWSTLPGKQKMPRLSCNGPNFLDSLYIHLLFRYQYLWVPSGIPQMLLSGTKYVQPVELSFYQWRCPSVRKRGDNSVKGFSFRWHFSGLPLIKYFWNGLWENILRS